MSSKVIHQTDLAAAASRSKYNSIFPMRCDERNFPWLAGFETEVLVADGYQAWKSRSAGKLIDPPRE
jgi:hypothetical protein